MFISQSGVSLIEVMVASLTLGLGTVGTLTALNAASRVEREARALTYVEFVAADVVAHLRMDHEAAALGRYNGHYASGHDALCDPDATCVAPLPATSLASRWLDVLAESAGPDGWVDIGCGASYECALVIGWRDPAGVRRQQSWRVML
ncbi:Tfp pilus assembly protein PilV [Luteibacter sp. Sphag1AF]|uniref:hypothetical protein n=1 Tax=Luteibacter sp. Sphag1AF TaxID=2587031 RepID=UPI00160F74BE|nr:hypothetical protein [Luteibacter sp. Sphag1AF]MBB3228445.1 Tfp pilus assembly protein PilV [Luteibacter sp. Sphag1AF]